MENKLTLKDFPGGSDGKVSVYNAGDLGSIPGLGRFPGEGNGNPLQCSCLENPMDGGALWATVHGVAKSWTRLSDFTFTFSYFWSHLISNKLIHNKINVPQSPTVIIKYDLQIQD